MSLSIVMSTTDTSILLRPSKFDTRYTHLMIMSTANSAAFHPSPSQEPLIFTHPNLLLHLTLDLLGLQFYLMEHDSDHNNKLVFRNYLLIQHHFLLEERKETPSF
jgi:hypothetical protein